MDGDDAAADNNEVEEVPELLAVFRAMEDETNSEDRKRLEAKVKGILEELLQRQS